MPGNVKSPAKIPFHPSHPERICWGCDKRCPADDLSCGNGSERSPHPAELFGEDWYEWAHGRDGAEPSAAAVAAAESPEAMQARVIDALREVIDPEFGLNVVDLGLVHHVDVDGAANVLVDLLMPTPAYPTGEQILLDAGRRVRALAGVHSADVRLVREQVWSPDRMSQAARDARSCHR